VATDADPRLAVARGYPYDVPRRSYRFLDGAALPLDGFRPDGRTPVLAVGSNRAPYQLARKYRGRPGTDIPVTVARLAGHDVVHSCHFARYGSVPARLWPSPGVTVEVAVTWLTPAQLQVMHTTEGAWNYDFERLDGLDLAIDGWGRVDAAFAYVGRHPPVTLDGVPVPLAAIAAEGRTAAAVGQAEMLALARDTLAPDAALDRFILDTIGCPVTRMQRSLRLRRGLRRVARPAGLP
jgi:hypothetical protein